MSPVLKVGAGTALSLTGLGALAWAAFAPISRFDAAERAESQSVSQRSSVAAKPRTPPDPSIILVRNLLRPDRRPPPTPYRPGQPSAPQAVPTPPAPSLVLVGVLLGSPPAAVMQGVPGTPGDRLVSLGDSVGGYVLSHIDPRSVVFIRGSSDTLRLELKELR